MTRLIDAEKLKKHYAWWDDDERRKLFDQIVDVQPTVDAVPLDGSFLKMSKGSYVIYQREWLYEHLEQEFDILRSVSGKPTIDAEPVRHGKWIEYPTADGMNQCSACGILRFGESNYCPQCGARMDEDD